MAQLFEYAAVYQPKTKRDADGNDVTPKAELIVPPTHILVDSERAALLAAARAIPEAFADKIEQVNVYVRPF